MLAAFFIYLIKLDFFYMSNLDPFKEYLSKEKNYSIHTINAYVNDVIEFNDFLESSCGIKLEETQYVFIRNWIVSLVDAGIANKSINRKISSLKSFFKFLLKVKIISVNPLVKHKSLKVSKKVQVPFSEKEVNDLFDFNNFPNNNSSIIISGSLDSKTRCARYFLLSLNPGNKHA